MMVHSNCVSILSFPHLHPQTLVGIEGNMALGDNLFLRLSPWAESPLFRRPGSGGCRVEIKVNLVKGLQQTDEHEGGFIIGELERID